MGYVSRPSIINAYTQSDTVLVANTAEKTTLNSTSYEKMKEIKLIQTIYVNSRFRFKFELLIADVGFTAYGKVYKNGVPVGTEYTRNVAGWLATSEDIDIGDWKVNDTIELWAKTSSDIHACHVKNFQMCGSGSPFINTLGM